MSCNLARLGTCAVIVLATCVSITSVVIGLASVCQIGGGSLSNLPSLLVPIAPMVARARRQLGPDTMVTSPAVDIGIAGSGSDSTAQSIDKLVPKKQPPSLLESPGTAFLASALPDETYTLRTVVRDDHHRVADVPNMGERLCVGAQCVGQRWMMIAPGRKSSDAILDYVLRAEHRVMEWAATVLLSERCEGVLAVSNLEVPTPTCAHHAPRGERPLFFDVGSNAGFYSMMAAASGADVVAIDPQPHCAQFVRAGALLSGFADRVRVINAFAAAEAKENAAEVRARSGCWGTYPSTNDMERETRAEYDVLVGGNATVSVAAISLPAIIIEEVEARRRSGRTPYVLAMKIDAEGSEVDVIGALDTSGVLKQRLVRNFMIEFNKDAVERNAPESACAVDVIACYARVTEVFTRAGYVALASVNGLWCCQTPIANATAFAIPAWATSDMW